MLRVPFLPSQLVMPRVRVAVVTGGQGSVQTALAAGTPLVGTRSSREQEWNTSVATQAGAGRAVFLPEIDTRLATTVRELAADGEAHGQRTARGASVRQIRRAGRGGAGHLRAPGQGDA